MKFYALHTEFVCFSSCDIAGRHSCCRLCSKSTQRDLYALKIASVFLISMSVAAPRNPVLHLSTCLVVKLKLTYRDASSKRSAAPSTL